MFQGFKKMLYLFFWNLYISYFVQHDCLVCDYGRKKACIKGLRVFHFRKIKKFNSRSSIFFNDIENIHINIVYPKNPFQFVAESSMDFSWHNNFVIIKSQLGKYINYTCMKTFIVPIVDIARRCNSKREMPIWDHW